MGCQQAAAVGSGALYPGSATASKTGSIVAILCKVLFFLKKKDTIYQFG